MKWINCRRWQRKHRQEVDGGAVWGTIIKSKKSGDISYQKTLIQCRGFFWLFLLSIAGGSTVKVTEFGHRARDRWSFCCWFRIANPPPSYLVFTYLPEELAVACWKEFYCYLFVSLTGPGTKQINIIPRSPSDDISIIPFRVISISELH